MLLQCCCPSMKFVPLFLFFVWSRLARPLELTKLRWTTLSITLRRGLVRRHLRRRRVTAGYLGALSVLSPRPLPTRDGSSKARPRRVGGFGLVMAARYGRPRGRLAGLSTRVQYSCQARNLLISTTHEMWRPLDQAADIASRPAARGAFLIMPSCYRWTNRTWCTN